MGVGGEPPAYDPARLQSVVDGIVDRLKRNDAEPFGVKVDGQYLVLSFLTSFRKQRADELLAGSYRVGGQIVYVRNVVVASEVQ